ncbi:TcpE family conjugal transfer membrane protein [Actinomadura sp. LOL_016]|uniref:TcpE family conjugal transfer membrane protein n=1 Tax=unclassified Actinomadura TaxID=2626254 RepID=UPI003A80A5BE
MDLPTYTNIWRIEKRLYKLYDLRLPMPLPLVQIGVFLGVFVPWIVMLQLVGIPFASPWHVLYIVPPGVLTWLATRPVIEGKRLTELLISQGRYLAEPRTWCRLTPIREPGEVVIVARVWRRPGAPAPAPERVAVKSRRKAVPPEPELPAPRVEAPPAAPRLEKAPSPGKRGLVSGVRRPGSPGFSTAMAPAEASAPAGEPGDKKVAGPVPTRPDIPMVPGAFGTPEPLVNEAQPLHPGGQAPAAPAPPQPPDRRVAGTGPDRPVPDRPTAFGRPPDPGESPRPVPPAPRRPEEHPAAAGEPQRRPSQAQPPQEPGRPSARPPQDERVVVFGYPVSDGVPAASASEPAPAQPAPGEPESPRAGRPGAPPEPHGQQPAAFGASQPGEAARPPQETRPVESAPQRPSAAPSERQAPSESVPSPARPPESGFPAASQEPGRDEAAASARESAPAQPAGGQAASAGAGQQGVAGRPGRQHERPAAARGEQQGASPESPAKGPVESAPQRPAAVQPEQRPAATQPEQQAPEAAPSQGWPSAPVRPGVSEESRPGGAAGPARPVGGHAVPAGTGPAVEESRPAGPAPQRPSEPPQGERPAAASAGEHGAPGEFGRPPRQESAPRTFGRPPETEGTQDERPAAAASGPGQAPAPGHQVPGSAQAGQGWPPAPDEAEGPRLEAPRPWSKGLSQPPRPAATDAQMWPPVPEPGVPPQDEEPPPRDVRSGPQSPVRPRPLPPPPAPPPSGPAITPPGPEHEVSAGGLRRLFQAVGGGHGDVDAEYQLRLQQPFRGTRHVVVLGCTGGAGQTVTALMLGHTFAQHNAEPVVAIDVNPGPGALARRTRSETNETLTGLITRADQVGSLTAMRRYTSQAKSGLDVIAAGKNPLQALDDRDYALAIRTIDRFYSVTLLDTAAAIVARVLPYADQLVLVAPASADAPRAVAMTYEWLDGHGYEELRSRAVTVINGVSRRSMDDVEQAEAVARGRCRALVRIPWDDHLSMDRAPRNELKSLRAPTRRAYLALAGVVAGGFGVVPERYQELHQEQEATR